MISWLSGSESSSTMVVEYVVKFPGLSPHDNSFNNTNKYMRCMPEVVEAIEKLIPDQPTKNIYDDINGIAENVTLLPRNLKQLHNKKYYETKKRNLEQQHVGFAKCN